MRHHKPPVLAVIAAVLLAVTLSHSQQGSITGEVPKCSTDGQYPGWSNSEGRYQCTTLASAAVTLLTMTNPSSLGSVGSNSTNFLTLDHNYAGSSPLNATEGPAEFSVPWAGTIDKLAVKTSTSQPSSNSCVVTIRKNAANTSLTVTISASASAGQFNDTSNSFSVAAGDRIAVQLANGNGNSSANFRTVSVRYTPTIP